ncbi:MAG: peptidase MA family metallohydrolase [Anaerolineae bacterium]|nr:peptidase MA family metallohydrolase [Anaerolineae bacterium]
MKKFIALMSLSILALGLTPSRAANAFQSPITFGTPRTEIDFPNSLYFEVSASSSAGEITSADLVYYQRAEVSAITRTRRHLEFTPGANVTLSYNWDTAGTTVIPNAPYIYYWEVTDSAGNQVTSPEYFVRYEDTRFTWDVVKNDDVAVWTHGHPASFGQQVFKIANQALSLQYPMFNIKITYQLQIVIYNTDQEFAEWHSTRTNAVGGEAFTNVGVTTQIVPVGMGSDYWLKDVIPHEISHMYFALATDNPKVSVPHWLNEGVATYNEFTDNSYMLAEVERAAASGDLIILSSLANGFGRLVDEDRFRFAYSESLSAVTYMIETYGDAGLSNLLKAYREGHPTDDAFQIAFGRTMSEFELDWAAWLGVPEGQYIIPTPWAMPTFPSAPTQMVFGGTPDSKPSPTPQDTAEVVNSATPEISATPLPAVNPEQRPEHQPAANRIPATLIFALLFGLLFLAGIFWVLKRKT